MITFEQEYRLKNSLPDFIEYTKARYVGPTAEVTCGIHEDIKKTIKSGQIYTGTFTVFPQAVLARVLGNVVVQTKPSLWKFMEEDDESY